MRCIICRPQLKTKKKVKTYIIVRTEISINEKAKMLRI